jgi:hypothetical protein
MNPAGTHQQWDRAGLPPTPPMTPTCQIIARARSTAGRDYMLRERFRRFSSTNEGMQRPQGIEMKSSYRSSVIMPLLSAPRIIAFPQSVVRVCELLRRRTARVHSLSSTT